MCLFWFQERANGRRFVPLHGWLPSSAGVFVRGVGTSIALSHKGCYTKTYESDIVAFAGHHIYHPSFLRFVGSFYQCAGSAPGGSEAATLIYYCTLGFMLFVGILDQGAGAALDDSGADVEQI